MAKERRKESERRSERQGSGICKERGDEFKASPTQGWIEERLILCANDWNERKANIRQDGKRS
jgi:hypothetical protein